MSLESQLFSFTTEALELLIDLALPSRKGNLLVLGSLEAIRERTNDTDVRIEEVNADTLHEWVNRPASFDSAIVVPRFDTEVKKPVLPAEGEWPPLSVWNREEYLIAHAWSLVRPDARVIALVGKGLLASDRGGRSAARNALRQHGLALVAEISDTASRGSAMNAATYVAMFERKKISVALCDTGGSFGGRKFATRRSLLFLAHEIILCRCRGRGCNRVARRN